MLYLTAFLLFCYFLGISHCVEHDVYCGSVGSISTAKNSPVVEKWIATIHVSSWSDPRICIGAFLNETTVITAASCLYDADLGRFLNTEELMISSNGGGLWEAEKVRLHQDFVYGEPENDVALVSLPVTETTKYHEAICLPNANFASKELLILSLEQPTLNGQINECQYQDNYDYYGGDIRTSWPPKVVNTSAQCCRLCQHLAECKLWTWGKLLDRPEFAGKCWLKRAQTSLGKNSLRISGAPHKRLPTTCIYLKNLDHYFDDIQSLYPVPSPSECSTQCRNTFNCMGWSYATATDGTGRKGSCWLKHTMGNKWRNKTNRISGLMKELHLQAYQKEPSQRTNCKSPAVSFNDNCTWNSSANLLMQLLIGRNNTSSPWHLLGIGRQQKFLDLTFFDVWKIGQNSNKPNSSDPGKVIKQEINVLLVTVICLSGFVLLCIIFFFAVCMICKRSKSQDNGLPKFQRRDIIITEKLGEGYYCNVWKGTLKSRGKAIPVAVKSLKSAAGRTEQSQLLREACTLAKLQGHKNIVKPMGLCLDDRSSMLLLEQMNSGSLLDFLKDHKARRHLGYKQMVKICTDICSACCFLEVKGYIHRDISARNCLVEACWNDRVVITAKLADFGLAKDVRMRYEEEMSIPEFAVAWMPPEGFTGTFSIKSDVWSFGVLIWEVFSWGSHPFGICSYPAGWHRCPMYIHNSEEIQDLVCTDQKTLLDLPSPCPSRLTSAAKELLMRCWELQTNDRPKFEEIRNFLNAMITCDLDTTYPHLKVVHEVHSVALHMGPFQHAYLQEHKIDPKQIQSHATNVPQHTLSDAL